MNIQGAVFDLDGTLTDSMYIWLKAPVDLVRRYGGDPPEDLAQDLKEMGRREAAEYLRSRFSLSATPEELMDALNDLVTEEYRSRVPMKPGADQLLSHLAARDIPCCIATASEVFQAQAAMERLGLWQHFRFAISCVQYGGKTRPDIYLEAARRLGTAPAETVVFEDALHAARPPTRRASGSAASGTPPLRKTRRPSGRLWTGTSGTWGTGNRNRRGTAAVWPLPAADRGHHLPPLDKTSMQGKEAWI